MRVYLTTPELATDTGKQLLQLCLDIAIDGKLELEEIKSLRGFLRANQESSIGSISYLLDILTRITSDGVIDRDELLELQLAVERVVPASHRAPIALARKSREKQRAERLRESKRLLKEKEKADRQRMLAEEIARLDRIQHAFAKVAGVTFQNEDGTERQEVLKRCKPLEKLYLQHDEDNAYSVFATKVLRANSDQIGYVPEYLAERVVDKYQDGYRVIGVLLEITGGTYDKPTWGANFVVFFISSNVGQDEYEAYIQKTLENRDQ